MGVGRGAGAVGGSRGEGRGWSALVSAEVIVLRWGCAGRNKKRLDAGACRCWWRVCMSKAGGGHAELGARACSEGAAHWYPQRS
jgi:hypothetical protein